MVPPPPRRLHFCSEELNALERQTLGRGGGSGGAHSGGGHSGGAPRGETPLGVAPLRETPPGETPLGETPPPLGETALASSALAPVAPSSPCCPPSRALRTWLSRNASSSQHLLKGGAA